MAINAPVEERVVRCAIYTRKSTDKALDAPVSSLTAKREVCQAYIKCQAHRNWVELPYRYNEATPTPPARRPDWPRRRAWGSAATAICGEAGAVSAFRKEVRRDQRGGPPHVRHASVGYGVCWPI